MPRKNKAFSEKSLTKGELRKLNALRKSLGEGIADDAFAKWYKQREVAGSNNHDPNIGVIQGALHPHLNKLHFAKGARYTLRRGRGRIIVEPQA